MILFFMRGDGHGFVSLENLLEFSYLVSNFVAQHSLSASEP